MKRKEGTGRKRWSKGSGEAKLMGLRSNDSPRKEGMAGREVISLPQDIFLFSLDVTAPKHHTRSETRTVTNEEVGGGGVGVRDKEEEQAEYDRKPDVGKPPSASDSNTPLWNDEKGDGNDKEHGLG
ncbi:hypothetical protein HPP92_016710 [Vanilla planifolia]|uniref:Uncharacterized protein n=1 Tax=Vanilla planifolia TaxID=51239 RepID=A0A835UQR1_VANPL|nr:hypothetical protein HPP92_016710 [Vanilla planifolia]